MNIPVETLAKAKDLLATRHEADTNRIGIYGISKGAELALISARRCGWIKAVVAFVPSDVVWAGYGRELKPGEGLWFWTWEGKSLADIPYDRYEDVFSGAATSDEVHRRSRARPSAEAVRATRISVEDIDARVLLIGGGQDPVWPSQLMTQAIVAERARAGLASRTHALTFDSVNHYICGNGTAVQRAGAGDADAYGSPALATADGQANAQAFKATLEFLKSSL